MGTIAKSLSLLAAAALLTACGGGGGGGGGGQVNVTPSAVITPSNADDIVFSVFSAAQFTGLIAFQFTMLGSELYGNFGPIAVGDTVPEQEATVRLPTAIVRIVDRYLNISGQVRVSPTAVIPSTEVPCDSGRFFISGDIADVTLNTATAGDFLDLRFQSCDGIQGIPGFLNGRLQFRVTRATSNRITLDLDFENLTLQDELYDGTVDGDLLVDLNGSTSRLQADRLAITENGDSYILRNLDSTDTADINFVTDFSVDVRSPDFDNEWVGVVVEQDLVSSDPFSNPGSGIVNYFGAADSAIRLTALSNTTARLEVDADGDMIYESSSDVSWASLRPPPPFLP